MIPKLWPSLSQKLSTPHAGPTIGLPSGGVADRAVEDLLDPHLAERRHAVDGGLDVRLQALQILLEQLVLAVLGRAVDVARGSTDLVGAEDQPAPLLAQIPRAVGLAQHPHLGQPRRVAGLNLRVRLGDDVLVLHRDDGDVQTDHRAGAPGEVTGRADHVLADDVALVGVHAPLAARGPGDPRDRGVAVDLRAAIARAGRERLGQIRRLHVAVSGVADRPDQAVDVAQRPDLLHLHGRQELDVDPDGARHARVLAILVHPIAVHREPDVADEPQAHVLAGLLLQGAVQLHRVLVDLSDGIAHVEQGEQPGRMPGRTGGQLPALHQHNVGPPLLREMVEGADSDDASADDDDASVRFHVRSLRWLRKLAPSLI